MTTSAHGKPPGPRVCPQCGRVLPADAPAGNCPACLAGLGLLSGQVEAAAPEPLISAEPTPVGIGKTVFSAAAEGARFEQPGERIGRYKLLQKIGEGGCGVVYVAEQEEPVRRRVALKVIKLGMDTRQVIARFEAERQALAMMDHPNIAKVHDGGTTETGRPYFVMELVRGVRITEYCDENDLSTSQRLNLFMQVCHAVQHAHQKGIIHRDLKPSNILVTINDGMPVPKVIDFGVAKAIEQRLTDKTIFTEFHQFIGTPAYMSPEQALMTSLDIDTRSDIYSLGVLLYELLTGRTPLDTREMLKAGVDEMRRTIREQEPPRPSNRLSTLPREDLTTTAKRQSTNPPHLIQEVSGDLDWIVMKCLEKNRTRRYETANGLAADLQRHLKHEAIAARPPSRLYQFQKMVRRNRGAFAATAAVLVTLLAGLALSTWAFVRERAARRQAAIEWAKSQQVTKFLKEMIQGVEPSVALGRDVSVLREIADQTLERMGKEQKVPPEVEVQLRATLGGVYHHLGDYKKAEALHRETLPRMRRLLGNEHPDLADLLRDFACVLEDRSLHMESEALGREALALSRRRHGREHPEVAKSLELIARSMSNQKKFVEGEALLRQSLDMNRKLHGPEHADLATGLGWLAQLLDDQDRIDEAEVVFREALAMVKKVRGEVHPEVASLLSHFATFREKHRQWREAEGLYRELLPLQKKLFGNERNRVAGTLNNLGAANHNSGRYAEAEPYLRESLALRKKLLGDEHRDIAHSLYNLGMTLGAQERLSEAEGMFREALAMQKKLLPPNHPETELTLGDLSRVLLKQQKLAEAEELFRNRLSLVRQTAAGDPKKLESCLNDLAETLYREKKYAEAEPIYQELIQSRRGRLPSANEDILSATASLARLFSDWAWVERTNAVTAEETRLSSKSQIRETTFKSNQGLVTSTLRSAATEDGSAAPLAVERAREGERLLRECLIARGEGTNAANWRTSDMHSRLGGAILSVAVTDPELTPTVRESKFTEAESLLLESNTLLQQSKSADRRYKRDGLERLVRLYEAWNKPDQLAVWRAKLEAFNQTNSAPQRVP